MKKLLLPIFLLTILFSFGAFAQMSEIECESLYPLQKLEFQINIDRAMNPSPWRRGHVTVYENSQVIKAEHYDLSLSSMGGFNRVRLWGEGMDLDIDLWPDSVPRFGGMYRATFRSYTTLNNMPFNNIECRFPWAK